MTPIAVNYMSVLDALGLRRLPQGEGVGLGAQAEVSAHRAGEEAGAARDGPSAAHHGLLQGEREDDATQEGAVPGGQGHRRQAPKVKEVS